MKKNIILIFLITLGSTLLKAQDFSNQEINVAAIPLERIALNTDRNFYIVGEKLWFKAYCFSSSKDIKKNLSNVLYVELYDIAKESSIKRKFKIKDRTSFGAIDIPSEFKSGNYILRAYTQYLKNFSPDYYYTQNIRIISPYSQLSKPAKPTSEIIDIIVEGNKLVSDIRTKVYFSIRNDYIGITEKIEILNEEELIHSFVKPEFGLGIFEFIPELNENYQLKLYTSSDTISKDLPLLSNDAVVLRSNNFANGLLNIHIFNNKVETLNAKLEIRNQYLNLIQSNDIILSKKQYNLSISREVLGLGINHLILTDLNGKLLNAISIYNGSLIGLNVETDKNEYLNREAVVLNIESKDFTDLKNVSVSVFKQGTMINGFKRSVLLNPVLLKSYLSNHFLEDELLDIALINYANFILPKELLEAKSNLKINWIPEIRDVSISGIAIDAKTNIPLAEKSIYLSVFKQDPQIHADKTKADGSFIFSLNNFENDHEIFISLKPESDLKYEILVNNDFQNSFSTISNLNLNIDQSDNSLIEQMSINIQANKLFETEAFGLQEPVQQLPFSFSQLDQVIDLTQYINSPDLNTIFRELIPSIKVRKKKGDFELRLYDFENYTRFYNPLVVVDNLPIFNMNEVMAISPKRILKISLINNQFQVGDEILNGVVVISTDTKDFGGIKFNPGSVFMEYQTISNPFKLEPIDYELRVHQNQTLADFRNLLFWGPQLLVKEKYNLKFYTSDHDSEYVVIVKGFTEKGQLCYGKTSFIVK